MPGGNGTGPMGMGPMTGRAAGYCAGYDRPGYANPVPGRGFGRGAGFGFGRGFGGGGRGWRNQFYATGLTGWQRAGGAWGYPAAAVPPVAPTREQELAALKSQTEYAETELEQMRTRIAELEADKEQKR